MGQYFYYYNLSKNEYIDQDDDVPIKDYVGVKQEEHCNFFYDKNKKKLNSNVLVSNLYYLLQNEWKGDIVINVGDYVADEFFFDGKTFNCSLGDTIYQKKFEKEYYSFCKVYIDKIAKHELKLEEDDEIEGMFDILYFFGKRIYTKNMEYHFCRYIYNLITKEYVDIYHSPIQPDSYYKKDKRVSFLEADYYEIWDPLSLLLAINGGGYGSFEQSKKLRDRSISENYFGNKYYGAWINSSSGVGFTDDILELEGYKEILPFFLSFRADDYLNDVHFILDDLKMREQLAIRFHKLKRYL